MHCGRYGGRCHNTKDTAPGMGTAHKQHKCSCGGPNSAIGGSCDVSSSSSAPHDASLEAGLLAHDNMGTKDGQAGEAVGESLRRLSGEPERYKDVARRQC